MKRTTYHHRLFRYALRGVIGRSADEESQDDQGGVFRLVYYPEDQSLHAARALRRHLPEIREWLDHFDVLFSKTQADWIENPYHTRKGFCLYIEVTRA